MIETKYRVLRTCMVLLMSALFTIGSAAAQVTHSGAARQIERAFSSGDAQTLLHAAADRLEVSLFGTSTSYSRRQALYVMQEFFSEYPPRRFMLEAVKQERGSRFTVGRYWYEEAEVPLRVYLYLQRKNGHGWVMHEIRIEGRGE